MQKNLEKSKKLKKAVRSKAKECYANAWRAIETQEEYKDATYVEGMAVVQGLVIEHGWVEHEGEIVDPTLLEADMAYFPGLRFQGRNGLETAWRIPGVLESGMELPIFYRFGWGGVNSAEFLRAIVDAYRFAGMDAVADSYLHRANLATPSRDTDKRPPLICTAGPEACVAWDEFLAGEGLQASTRYQYRQHALHFLRWLEAQGVGLAQVTSAHLTSYLDTQHTTLSQRHYRTPLRRLFALLVARHVLLSNPADVKRGKVGVPPAPTLAGFRTLLWRLGRITKDSPWFRPGLVAMYPMVVGGMDPQQIAAFTGMPLPEVELYAGRLRANGIWTPDGKAIALDVADPTSAEAILDFVLMIGCAAGTFGRTDIPASRRRRREGKMEHRPCWIAP
jgi:hypothetical protein